MRNESDNTLIIIALILLMSVISCKNDLPEISTNQVENITATAAVSGGRIISEGKSDIISYGICWDTLINPTPAARAWSDSTVKEEFDAIISGLLPKTTYYIRAFAVNSAGTGYGDELSFTTPPSVPVLITSEVSGISSNSLTSGGIVNSDGGSDITESGICWDTLPAPTIADSHIADSSGKSGFISEINGLIPGNKYYVRAYATNSSGTGYGEEKEYTVPKIMPLVTVFTITEKYLYSASCNVKSITGGGSKIVEYGVCWNTKPEPTTGNYKTSKQYGPGKLRMAQLKPGTKYYARLYAVNEEGTHYSKEATFKTLGSPPEAETLGSSDLTVTGAKVEARVNAGFLPTSVWIEYGPTEKYGQVTKTISAPVKGGSDFTFATEISGLKAGTLYHYRVRASNDLGTAYGKDETFMILKIPELKGFNPITKNYKDSLFYITPPISNSPGTFTYSSNNPKIVFISGNKGIIKGSGTCTITATQAPSGNFAGGNISTTFSMNVVDIDGNVYHTISIGDQDWMKENLKVTRYRNGQPIENVPENEKWITMSGGAFSWINNDTAMSRNNYGALYNWYAVSDSRKICPAGWHVPTDAEWQVMERFLGMTFAEADETILRGSNQGVQLKDSTGWAKNGIGSNSTEFSGLPAGLRLAETGEFYNLGADACWWTATEEDNYNAWMRNMYYYYNSIYRIPDSMKSGFSIRCVRDRRR